jgi:hypothetical protein
MFTYNNDTISVQLAANKFDELGEVDFKRLNKTIPFYEILMGDGYSKMPKNDQKICGGDCFEWLNKFFNF